MNVIDIFIKAEQPKMAKIISGDSGILVDKIPKPMLKNTEKSLITDL